MSWNQGNHSTSTSTDSWLLLVVMLVLLGSQFDAWTTLVSSDLVSSAAPINGRVSEWAASLWPLLCASPVSELKLEAAKTNSLPHGLVANETIWRACARARRPGDCLLLDLREHLRLDSISMGLEPETLTSCTNSNSLWSTIWLIVQKKVVCVWRPLTQRKGPSDRFSKGRRVVGDDVGRYFKCRLNSSSWILGKMASHNRLSSLFYFLT
jgi:hypothetical protein